MILVLATRNVNKVREMKRLLAGLPFDVRSVADYPAAPDVVEDGETLEANAEKKARSAARATGEWSLADDTGLEVAALGGAPGVYSARFAGEGCSYEDNNRKLLEELAGRPAAERGAVFRCVMALAAPDGRLYLDEGRLEGRIAADLRGTDGFGYDPVFELPESGRRLAELNLDEKNAISHRGLALHKVRERLAALAA